MDRLLQHQNHYNMRGKLKKEGQYKLFKSDHGHDILRLEDQAYALIEGDEGDLIIHSDEEHDKSKSISSGKFFLADFEDDPEFRDQPHLFLEDGDQYKEMLLPNGLPTDSNHQKKLIRSDEKVSRDTVMEHVKGKGNKGSEEQYEGKEEGLRNKNKDELYDLAQKHDIEGRSDMDKDQLIEALKGKVQD